MRRVLFVTYYWPPAGGPGVQRVLKFCKYLPEFGWEPVVLTAKRGEYPATDPTLIQEVPSNLIVYATRALQPFGLYKRVTGKSLGEGLPVRTASDQTSASARERLARYLRANLFIPDARIGWYPYALGRGLQLIRIRRPSLIYTSGPPHSVHLIGRSLAAAAGLCWVADFRDPWTDLFYYNDLGRGGLAERVDKAMERSVLQRADAVVSVSQSFVERLRNRVNTQTYFLIYNGYDEQDFAGKEGEKARLAEKFGISYAGNLSRRQLPENLLRAVGDLCAEQDQWRNNLKLSFYGSMTRRLVELLDEYGLSKLSRLPGYAEHGRAIDLMCRSAVLLVLVPTNDPGAIPAKLFECVRSGNRVLVLSGQPSEAGQIVKSLGCGEELFYDDFGGQKEALERCFELWRGGLLESFERFPQFERRSQAQRLAEVFEKAVDINA